MRAKELLAESIQDTFFKDAIEKNKKGLEAVKKSGIKLVPFGTHPKNNTPVYLYDNSGRPTVVVDMGGFTVPFYNSSGLGGKEKVESDKWYPFFGIGSDGWFNKTKQDDINDFYGSTTLRTIAHTLDSILGRPSRDPINVSYSNNDLVSYEQFKNVVNRGLTPVSNVEPFDKYTFIKSINNLLKKVGGKQYKLPAAPAGGNTAKDSEPVVGKLTLSHGGEEIQLNIGISISKAIVKKFGEDSKFWDENQFKLEKTPENTWKLIPNPGAVNKTMIDGVAVTSPVLLKKGMRVAVGNPAKKAEKLPLTVG